MQLENKVAVVTGAASGIGRASAIRLARDGADIAVQEIAHAVSFFASPGASYVTGTYLLVAGGRTLH